MDPFLLQGLGVAGGIFLIVMGQHVRRELRQRGFEPSVADLMGLPLLAVGAWVVVAVLMGWRIVPL